MGDALAVAVGILALVFICALLYDSGVHSGRMREQTDQSRLKTERDTLRYDILSQSPEGRTILEQEGRDLQQHWADLDREKRSIADFRSMVVRQDPPPGFPNPKWWRDVKAGRLWATSDISVRALMILYEDWQREHGSR